MEKDRDRQFNLVEKTFNNYSVVALLQFKIVMSLCPSNITQQKAVNTNLGIIVLQN